ncbi:MAG TPA: phosphopantetheine-binding protein [Opitutaceae bacterium]|jgi:acyl carrier protein
MSNPPPQTPKPGLSRFPAEVLEAYQRYKSGGDGAAVEAVVIAAVIDYSPAEGSPVEGATDKTRLAEDLGYDSVAVAELVFFLEDLFDVTLANEDIVDVRTIGDLRACVNRKLAGKAGPA